MALGALLVVFPIAAWLFGARNLTTVRVMQVALAAQVALSVVNFWRMNEQTTKKRECQQQQQKMPAKQPIVFFCANDCYVKAPQHVAGETSLLLRIAQPAAVREEVGWQQYVVPNFQSTDVSQRSPARHSWLSNELSSEIFPSGSPYGISNVFEVSGTPVGPLRL